MKESATVFAKRLRSNMTDAEKLLWYHLRGHRFLGTKFKRQQPLGDYIVDFVCFEAKLVIEVDGGQHLESESDNLRDAWLQEQGFRILRFWNNEVLGETESVLGKILQYLTPSPQPLSHQGRGEVEEAPQDYSLSHQGRGEVEEAPQDYSLSHQGRGGVEEAPQDYSLSPRGRGLGRGGKDIERIRWRARRGLLELDIVLEHFIETHYARLSETEQNIFETLLDMPDNPLWDMIMDRQETMHAEQQALLEKIRAT